MNAFDLPTEQPVAHAIVDAEGRLRSADPAIDALNLRAGGRVGAPIAVPQLASVARLARRLGIVVSRRVVVADEEADIELWVRARPEAGVVRLSASGWRERGAWQPDRTSDRSAEGAERDFLTSDAEWRWETDAQLRLTFVSLDAGPRYGFDAVSMLGRSLTALFALDSDAAEGLPILSSLARRRPLVDQPARLRPSGRMATLSAELRRDRDGAFAGFIGGVRMIADAAVAKDARSLPDGFTNSLDAALRTPLSRIVANADSINAQADGPVAKDYADYAADIASAGRHLLGLVDDLVDLQAIERPGFTPARDPIDLADVARRAAGLLVVRADAAGVEIVRPTTDMRLPASADFRRTLQIMVNLIGNALRYSPRGGTVTVAVERRDTVVAAMVTDAGKGIEPQDQARIFAKFERVDPGEPGGSGLGLYIARTLARAMRGDLTVDSMPGAGARFTLTLPAR